LNRNFCQRIDLLLITSQLPTEQWYQSIGDATLADDIFDRLIHKAHRIELRGKSMRKRLDSLTQAKHLEQKNNRQCVENQPVRLAPELPFIVARIRSFSANRPVRE